MERTFTDQNSDFFTDFLMERTFTDQNSDFFTDFLLESGLVVIE